MFQFPKRLRPKASSPTSDSSVLNITKILEDEIGPIPSKFSANQNFIPFIRERDSIGRLLCVFKTKKTKGKTKSQSKKPEKNSWLLKPNIKTKKKLISQKYKGDIPPVGLYNLQEKWIKKSYSNKTLSTFSSVLPPANINRSLTPTVFAKVTKQKTQSPMSRKTSSVAPRKKGIWESLPVYNTPEQISTILSFKVEKQDIMARQLNISQSLEKFKTGYFM